MRTEAPAVSSDPFSPLKNATFRAIWLAGLVSGLGWLIQTVAMSWLMATISSSDLMVALVQAATTLPPFLLSMFAGAIVDNFDRRKVMLVARSLMTAAGVALTIVVALGFLNPWVLLGFSFLAGCGIAFNDPAWQASVGDIVKRHDLPAAVTLTSVGFNTIRSVGPALGGIILASFGPLIAFALYTLCLLVPLIVVWRCEWEVRTLPLPPESLTTAISDGVRFATMSAEIMAAIARGVLFGLTGIAVLALLPLIVRDHLQAGPVMYGALMAGFGGGALLTGLSSGFLRRMLSAETLLKVACFACAACSAALASTSSSSVAAVALTLGGAGWVIGWSGFNVSVQWASPRWVVGRTISIYYALTYGGIAAGSWLWGATAQNYSLATALEASAGALLLVAAIGFILPIQECVESDDTPSEGVEAPAVSLGLQAHSGPIMVKINYQISPENIDAFLDLMRQRRRVRSRIGARQWTLLRNLQNPFRWTETFRTATWGDYLRLNHRLTAADKQLDDRLSELHRGRLPPAVDLLIERPTAPAPKTIPLRSVVPQP
ncbi:MFS transporter [Bradyrhizobium liaoningense]|uniref:MFS transporter n=1 Tax=Bradyrhizobium liaoningense TaxID=43992 RepID=UPI001BADD9DA|nr:MFS transporter [Bradyrhizobium liaoningense]MBR0857759.1 MFS transporter [Bradyrhizobium liaoningense]